MKELTKAEEQLMQILWKLEKAFVKDIVAEFSEPKPAYTTVTTIIRILVQKKFIAYKSYGKVHEYYPLVSKSEYIGMHFKSVVRNYFNDNYSGFASFFTRENDISLEELEEIRKIIDDEIESKRK